jgi:hypothetical protein
VKHRIYVIFAIPPFAPLFGSGKAGEGCRLRPFRSVSAHLQFAQPEEADEAMAGNLDQPVEKVGFL